MIYQKKNKNINIKRIVTFGLIALFLILGLLQISFVNSFVGTIFSPVLSVKSGILPFSNISNFFSSRGELSKKVLDLEEEVRKLKIENLKVQILENENKELRFIHESSENKNSIFGKVLLRPPYSPYDTITIDIGGEVVNVGSKIYYGDILIGSIAEVTPRYSVANLVSSPDNNMPVRIRGEIDAVAVGRGGGRMIIEIPKDAEVSEGDVITDSSSGISIVGIVSTIDFNEADSFKTVYTAFPVSLGQMPFVEIVN